MWRNVTFKCHPETAAFCELLRATRAFVSVSLLFYFFFSLLKWKDLFGKSFLFFFFFSGHGSRKAFIDPRCYKNNSSLIFETISMDVVTAEFWLASILGQWVDTPEVLGVYFYKDCISSPLTGVGLDPGLNFSTRFIVGSAVSMRCQKRVTQRRFKLILKR